MELGPVVRQRRRDLGLRQDELADLAGVSTRFVHTLEAGKPSVQMDRVVAVLEVLGLELAVQPRRHDGEPAT
ncbi:MAG TPA: helix-turn-helix transcriptional regulator [Egicoccus sp.]|nr:helix-turn-helix transcriptional regulator [Egicoccus sp.]HSK24815.1 helix-turn-helix transcriptional regulator [Egicoccus sp.]